MIRDHWRQHPDPAREAQVLQWLAYRASHGISNEPLKTKAPKEYGEER